MSGTWTQLIIGCPACCANGREAGAPSQWVHANCGGNMEVSDLAKLRCASCSNVSHIKNWRWGCPQHGDPQREDYYQATNSSAMAAQISVAGALTTKMGRKWLMQFLDNLDEW